jgi:DNA modification methylase/ParB-like chromosome segregation protein Spo0J
VNDKRIGELAISEIKISKAHRNDMGDIEALARNIEEVGLLHPIGVTPDKKLIFGQRRIRAYELLGRSKIPARIIDIHSILLGEFSENFFRKDYTASEKVAIVEAMRSFKHGGDRRSKQSLKSEDGVTVDDAAKVVGFGGKDRYYHAKSVVEKGIPELVEAMDSRRLSVSAAARLAEATPEEQTECLTKRLDEGRWTANGVNRALHRVRNANKREATLSKSVEASDDSDAIQIYHCPFQELEKKGKLEAGSVKLICTDIPYCDTFLPELEDLAEQAKRLLVPGGLFVAYLGQHRLDDKFAILSRHLKYGWLATSAWTGAASPVLKIKAMSKSISIGIYSKGNWSPERKWCDTLFVEAREKEWHEWQRPLEEVENLVSHFSDPGDLVVDPCGGGFTTAVACQNLGRRFVGCDIDKAAVVNGQERLALKAKVLPFSKAKPVRANSVTEGDCRQLIPRLPDCSIGLCLTSPPYAEQRKGTYPSVPERQYPQFTVDWMAKLWDKLTDDGSAVIVIDPHVKDGVMSDYVRRTEEALCDFGWKQHQTQIWYKRDRAPLGHKDWPRHCWESVLWFSKTAKPFCDPCACGQPSDRLSIERIRNSRWSPGGKKKRSGIARVPDVWNVPIGGTEKGIAHSAMFPVELAERLIATFCPAGGTVLDPFAGSGSTLVAAKKLGCDYYGFDVVADYCKIARKRLTATIRGGSISKAG